MTLTEAVNEAEGLTPSTPTDRAGPEVAARERTGAVLREVYQERRRQDTLVAKGKFLWNCAEPKAPWTEKFLVLEEEVGEVAREIVQWIISRDKYAADPQLKAMPPHREAYYAKRLRTELIQIAACCVAWAESLGDGT